MGKPPASPGHEDWLNWLPLPAVIVAADGSAATMNSAWATLLGTTGGRWLDAVEPPLRPALRARLRLAVATGETGSADCWVTGTGESKRGRLSRWWWHPVPPHNLVVCVGMIEDGQAAAPLTAPGDARGPADRGFAGPSPGVSISAEVAMAAVRRIFEAGLALESAAGLLEQPLAGPVLRALADLDQLVNQIRSMVFEPRPRAAAVPPAQGGY
jgi:hypothetical protein